MIGGHNMLYKGALQPNEHISKETLPIFINFCEQIAQTVSSCNIHLQAYNDNGISKFLSLEDAEQFQILTNMKSFNQNLIEATSKQVSLVGDNRKHAWFSMRNLGLRPPNDLFDKIDQRDMIEIYDISGIQLFRSIELYNYMSYSFSEIFCFSWKELFSRDEFVFHRMSTTVSDVLSRKFQGCIFPQFPSHCAYEIFSEKKIWIKMESGIMSKLTRMDGTTGGFIYTFKIPEHGVGAKH